MMLELLKEECNVTYTENGAITPRSSGAYCLDLFGTIGALRFADENAIVQRFQQAYTADKDTAMKILFYARDVREGLGERRVFRIILRYLAQYYPQSVLKNLTYIQEYGRFDDYLCLMDTACEDAVVQLIREQLQKDLSAMGENRPVSLLAKWLPSLTSSNKEKARLSRTLAKKMGMQQKEYRKMLSKLRKYLDLVEIHLTNGDFTFDYSNVPSKAMLKYRSVFQRKDDLRFGEYLEDVCKGEKTMHTAVTVPYEVIRPLIDFNNWCALQDVAPEQRQAVNIIWQQLMNETVDENALVVMDSSGSMYCHDNGRPILVALSLAIYYGKNCKGKFHNHFITFSNTPRLVEIKGEDIVEQVQYCSGFCEMANTNLERVFDLLLRTAVQHRLPQEELPEKLYIISDMEFDACVRDTSASNFASAKSAFEALGYRLPKIVFWNVASRRKQQPVKMHTSGTALVSGCSPRIFSMVMNDEMDPYQFMMEVLSSPRYQMIVA